MVIPVFSGPRKLLNRNLLYTAVTRAKQMVVVVGNLGKVNDMIDNIVEQKRYTGFEDRLRELTEAADHSEYMAFFDEDELRVSEPEGFELSGFMLDSFEGDGFEGED